MTKAIFITGVAGFLGSSLARRCQELGWEVHGIDLVPYSDARRLEGVHLTTYRWGSLVDVEVNAVPLVNYIVHAGAVADVPFAEKSPSYTMQQNVMGTQRLMEAIRLAHGTVLSDNLERVAVMSSESVYGHTFPGRIAEDTTLNPTNIYAASKAAEELVARSYYHSYGLPVSIIRSSTIFGPGGRLNQVMPIFLRQALDGKEITVHGDGKQSRDFQYIDNAVDGILKVLECDQATGDVFNIAGDNEISVVELAHACVQVTGSGSQVVHTPQRPGEQDLHLTPDISHARQVLGYEPLVSFEEGLKYVAGWLSVREQHELPTR